jgi:hypothetical protein
VTFPAPSGGRQGRQGCLRLTQAFLQPRRLLGGRPGRADPHHPCAPCRFPKRGTTGPLDLLSLGRQPLVTPDHGTPSLFEGARRAWRHPRGDPGVHGLRWRPGQGQRREVNIRMPCQIRPGFQRTHLPIADQPPTGCRQPCPETRDARDVSAVISSVPRQDLRRQGEPSRVQGPEQHCALRPRRLILARATLQQPLCGHCVRP